MERVWLRRMVALMVAMTLMMAMPMGAVAESKAPAPTAVVLDMDKVTVVPGTVVQLKAVVEPAGASQKLTWKSSNKSIATVNSAGRVIAVRPGIAKITATTKTGKKAAGCTVTVSIDFNDVQMRFFGIGNAAYSGGNALPACRADLEGMISLFRKASIGGKFVDVNGFFDQTAAQMVSTLEGMANNREIDENDITIFYYTGHGMDGDGAGPGYHGALVGVDFVNSLSQVVTVDTVQSYLDRVPGTVIVILDSCYSGQFIKNKGGAEVSVDQMKRANDAWVKAMASSKATNFDSKALTGSPVRTKYRLLTAASNNQMSVAMETSLFTEVLCQYLDTMKADANKDNVISLHEAYTKVHAYIQRFCKAWNKANPRSKLEQVTQVWPSKNAMPIYARTF